MDNAARPNEVAEAAARLATDDSSLAAVARWFNVNESQLLALIPEAGPEPAASAPLTRKIESPFADDGEGPTPARPFGPFERTPVSPGRSTSRVVRPPANSPSYVPPPPAATAGRRSPASPVGIRDFMQSLRRRALIVVIGIILGATAGWVTAPGATTGGATTFQATHTSFHRPAGAVGYNIDQVALLATSGEVPSRVAVRLHLDRGEVRAAVTTSVNNQVGTISITGRSSTADGAESLATVTAEELAALIDAGVQAAHQAEIGRLNAQLTTARNRLNAAKYPAEQGAARAEVDAAQRALEQYQQTSAPESQLQTLEPATASAVGAPGVQVPQSRTVRAALLGGIGLLVGVAGAFALSRIDSRIRSKAAAEEAFGAPVVAEIPRLSKADQGQLLARTQPSSSFVEAYRGLRTYVALWAPETGEDDGHRVIVVTSPSPGEGKTTTVAHLAAMLAEIGRSVVVVSADLRRPRIHQYFDRSGVPGLVDVLARTPEAPSFADLDLSTPVRGVQLVPSGPPVENPGSLLEHAADLVHAVRNMADFVLIDCPPLLVANDAVEFARHSDGVLLVARAGQTPFEAAEHCAELLSRLEIPVVGTVLVASESASTASRYYASHYYGAPERTGLLRRRGTATNGVAAPAPEAESNSGVADRTVNPP